MSSKVYSYYSDVPGRQYPKNLIALWEGSWRANGWEPVILSANDAKSHHNYQAYYNCVSEFPTVNPFEYEMACYLRWLAMANVGGGLMTDYDVINMSFAPKDLKRGGGLLILEPTGVPCALLGDKEVDYVYLCNEIATYQPTNRDRVNGRRHVSDMTIIRQNKHILRSNSCVEYGCSGSEKENDPGDGWRTAPLVHFSTHMAGRDKFSVAQECFRTRCKNHL